MLYDLTGSGTFNTWQWLPTKFIYYVTSVWRPPSSIFPIFHIRLGRTGFTLVSILAWLHSYEFFCWYNIPILIKLRYSVSDLAATILVFPLLVRSHSVRNNIPLDRSTTKHGFWNVYPILFRRQFQESEGGDHALSPSKNFTAGCRVVNQRATTLFVKYLHQEYSND